MICQIYRVRKSILRLRRASSVYSTEGKRINELSNILSFFAAASIDFMQIRQIRTSINAKLNQTS